MIDFKNTAYTVKYTNDFKKNYKKIKKQGKDIKKLKSIIFRLANKEMLESKFKPHPLKNDKKYKDCLECHIEPDWLLVYKYQDNELILLLVATGSHSAVLNM